VLRIIEDDLSHPAMIALIRAHRANLKALAPQSPPQSHHALTLDGLRAPDVTLWGAWDGEVLAGCVALKTLDASHGEIKSMRTANSHLRRGVATQLLAHVGDEARHRGYRRLSLETGSQPGFAPARAFYERHGFRPCSPFGNYVDDPNSVYMTRAIEPALHRNLAQNP